MEDIVTSGKLYFSGGSQFSLVQVRLASNGNITIKDDDQLIDEYALEKIKAVDKLGSLERELTLPDGGLLLLNNQADINGWLDGDTLLNRLFDWESSQKMVLVSVVMVPLSLYVIFKFLVPAMAIQFAEYVPDSYVNMASKQTLYAMDKTLLDPTELAEKQQQEFQQYWQHSLIKLELDPRHYQINFRHTEKMGPNAFAFPNGNIIITDQLVKLLENDKDILQAILLHEIGHVEHRHSMRLIAQSLATTVIFSYLFSDLSVVADLFVGAGATVAQNQFSQDLEWQADNYALEKLKDLGGNGESFTKAMEKFAEIMGEESEIELWLGSHPSFRKRIENARQSQLESS